MSQVVIALLVLILPTSCDFPFRKTDPQHPCNFPDVDTEINLREPRSYKIIDKVTSRNLVGITKNAIINADSVVLLDDNLQPLPPKKTFWVDNWIFENLDIYKDMPMLYDDPEAYLNLKQRTFYLKTAYNDYDTIIVSFHQCLVLSISFNGLPTLKPNNDIAGGGAGCYFKK